MALGQRLLGRKWDVLEYALLHTTICTLCEGQLRLKAIEYNKVGQSILFVYELFSNLLREIKMKQFIFSLCRGASPITRWNTLGSHVVV